MKQEVIIVWWRWKVF